MDSKIFLGKYRVAPKEIAAVGEVTDSALAYKAEEIDSGKQVVVEVVPAGSLKQAVRERLEAEALAAKKLNHVNIPILSDFGVAGDHLIYVTEDFEGTSADKWVNTHGPMPAKPVLCIASQVVSALGAASFHGISHHSLNPSNLVLVPGQTAEGEWPLIKVLHFVGVPPKVSQTDAAVAAFDPSLHYASPEQIKNGTVDFRSELYSLGATMWFLMTGAPPLVAAGPTTTPSGKAGVAAEKIDAMPEKVRGLLAQMLAANPEMRPRDPLAFYRTLQDCLHQVERRETKSRASGIPARAPAPILDHPGRRRFPFKRLARAAAFLAVAAVAALLVSGYLRHRRAVLADEPIGKPVGVPETAASAPPIVAEARAIASIAQTASTPAPLAVSGPPKDSQPQEPEIVVVNNSRSLPTTVDSREVVSSKPAEPEPVKSPDAEAVTVAPQTESEAIKTPEVRRAEPADEPEVRRAELVRSNDGPTEVKPNQTTSLVLKRTDSKPEIPPEPPAVKTEQPAKPKRQANEKTYLLPGYEFEPPPPSGRLPRGSVRGRFVGETADGRWMFELPSREIVTVQPPSSR